jgi:hypothetical protein
MPKSLSANACMVNQQPSLSIERGINTCMGCSRG